VGFFFVSAGLNGF